MKRLIVIITIIIAAYSAVFGQKEFNNWYFGYGGGITFNTEDGSPAALNGGKINTWEGTSVISGQNGDLLFYTDGSTVWNKDHSVMENGTGLYSHFSSTEGALIIKSPGSDKYYIFTTDADEGHHQNEFNYSKVDINEDGGLGAVTEKNVPLLRDATERLSAVPHANGEDIWVVTFHPYEKSFYSFKVTKDGIDNDPVISGINSFLPVHNIGQMNFSPNGRKIAFANYMFGNIILAEFDRESGRISNSLSLQSAKLSSSIYGLEFSPRSNKLYVAEYSEFYGSKLVQFDLTRFDPDAIENSAVVVSNGLPHESFGQLKLAPDWKIYIVREEGEYLSRINDPDKDAAECGFEMNAVDLESGRGKHGLPNFIRILFAEDILISSNSPVCEDETLRLFFENHENFPGAEIRWTGPDGFISHEINPVINRFSAAKSGRYYLEVEYNHKIFRDSINAVLMMNPYELVYQKSLDFGRIRLSDSGTASFRVKNIWDSRLEFNQTGIRSGEGAFTILSPEAPFTIDGMDSIEITVRFDPSEEKKYNGTLYFINDEFCKDTFEVALSGEAYTSVAEFSLPDTTANVRDMNFKIPLKMKSNVELQIETLVLEVRFDKSAYWPESYSGANVTDDYFEGDEHVLIFEFTDLEQVSGEEIEIASMTGFVLLTDEDQVPLKMKIIKAVADDVDLKTYDGTLRIRKSICRPDLRIIEVFQPGELTIGPNPARDEIELTIDSDLNIWRIEIISTSGEKLYSAHHEKSGKDEDLKLLIDLKDIPSGVYFVRCTRGEIVLSEKLLVRK